MSGLSLFRGAIAFSLLALLASCAEMEPPQTATTAATAPTPIPGYWNGDGVSGSPKIVVSISEQRAYFYKGKNLVGESSVSTGKPGFGTPPGHYSVVWKDKEHVSTVFGDYVDDFGNVVKSNIDSRKDSKPSGSHYDGARMPYAMFFRGGYAMHQGYVPRYAASHGCIRLPAGMAETFFNNAPYGTPVIVKQEAVMQSVRAPVPNPVPTTVAPPAPQVVRTNAPAPVHPATVRAPVSAPTPPALHPSASVRHTVPSPTPVSVRSATVRAPVPTPTPLPLRPSPSVRYTVPSPTPVSVRPASVRSTGPAPMPVPVRSPSPAPLRSPAPVLRQSPAPPRSSVPASAPVRSPLPGPVRSPTPVPKLSPVPASVHPTPAPVHSRKQQRVHSRTHPHSPTPSPTPAH
jgi:L,D-transpeptidase catalytic domain